MFVVDDGSTIATFVRQALTAVSMNTCAPFFGRIVALTQPLGFYRIHGNSLTTVAHSGCIHVSQMKRRMRHALAEKSLLQRLAHDRGLLLANGAFLSNWKHMKLRMSLERLFHPADLSRFKALFGSACGMAVSVVQSYELTAFRKAQHIVWAFTVALLPSGQAAKVIEYAFDYAPSSRFSKLLRRM